MKGDGDGERGLYSNVFIFHLKKLPLTRQNYGIFHDFSVWGFGCLRQPQRLHALSPCLALHGLPFVSESRLSYGIFQNLCVFVFGFYIYIHLYIYIHTYI